MARVSIILAIYRAEAFLEACLADIAAQSFRDFEAICVDDGSPDRSGDIVRAFAARDPRFRLLVNPERRGGGASRNRAMREASGAFVYFMDPDDRLHPRMLECALSFAEREKADVVSFSFRRNAPFAPDAPLSAEIDALPYRVETRPFFRLGRGGAFRLNYNYWTKLYRRSALDGAAFIEGGPENPHILSDFHHTALALFRMRRCVMLREPLYSYTVRPGSETKSPIGRRQIENYRLAVNDLADRLEADRDAAVRRQLRSYVVSSVVRHQWRRLERLRADDPAAFDDVQKAYREELAELRRRGLLGGPGFRLRHLREWRGIHRLLRA